MSGSARGILGMTSKYINKTITVRDDKKIQFRDTGIYIYSSADGVLDIVSDGSINLTGTFGLTGDFTVTGNFEVTGNFTFGDAVADTLIVMGRVSTSTVAGAALDIDSTYTRNELFEIRADVSDWTNIPVNYDSQQQFIGGYYRAQSAVDDAQGWLIGLQGWGVSDAAGHSELTGVFGYAYAKGDTTDTVGEAYGIRGEFSMDAGRANTLTLTTRAAGVLSYITSGKVDNYTKIHGFVGSFGDMDGGSRVYGSGLLLIDGPESGTCTLTSGVDVAMGAVNGILISGATTDAFKVTGSATNGLNVGTGTFTTGVLLGGTLTTGVSVGACTTAYTITGAVTTGYNIAGNATDAFKITSGTITNGLNIAGAVTTGVLIAGVTTTAVSVTGNATTALSVGTGTFTTGLLLGGTLTTGVSIGTATTGVAITGATTTAIDITGAATTGIALTTGAFTTGINIAGITALTTGVSVGLTGVTTTTAFVAGVTGSTTTTGFATAGTVTTGIALAGTLTTGMDVGTCTTAINISGNVTTGLLIAGTQTTAIRINGAGTNLLAFDAVEGALSTQATAFAGLSSSHKLAVLIDGVGTVYVPLITTF